MTERVGLFGWPLGHSISPAMHNAAFAVLGMDWTYDLLPVPPERLGEEVGRLLGAGYRGFNVTVPHKQTILEHLPNIEMEASAAQIGAANTVIVEPDGGLIATNTDWQGFTGDLRAHDIDVAGKPCLILGTGGAARAIIYALKQMGASAITLISHIMDVVPPDLRPDTILYTDLKPDPVGLIVNCSPVGMSPHIDRSPWPADLPFPSCTALYDLVYNPSVTRLMLQAQAAGVPTIVSGLGMLVRQGALAFEAWTDIEAPIGVMMEAGKRALGEG
ncbi:MAG: shikimate dehydrogenase [Anaerolineae bacterium]|nr:shikimate dehydrogenase [Anaerolineae bacterium]